MLAFSCLVAAVQAEYADWVCLLTTSLWFVQQFAPHIVFVTLTSCLAFLRTITKSMRCQYLERGCIHDVLLRVGRRKTVLVISTFLQKSSAIVVALSYSFSPNHSFPGLVVCAHSSIEVSQEDEFVSPGCSRNHRIQIIIELVFDLIWVGHWRCIGTQ